MISKNVFNKKSKTVFSGEYNLVVLDPMEKKYNKAKWLSGEALQIAVKRREMKGKGGKERYTHLNAENSSRKLEIPNEHFMQRWAQ